MARRRIYLVLPAILLVIASRPCFAACDLETSVRQAGATLYLNFGKRWIQGFAVTISRRMIASFAVAGMSPAALENRRVRVRGWIERRGGPRIEAFHPGQIELVGDNTAVMAGGK